MRRIQKYDVISLEAKYGIFLRAWTSKGKWLFWRRWRLITEIDVDGQGKHIENSNVDEIIISAT